MADQWSLWNQLLWVSIPPRWMTILPCMMDTLLSIHPLWMSMMAAGDMYTQQHRKTWDTT